MPKLKFGPTFALTLPSCEGLTKSVLTSPEDFLVEEVLNTSLF